MSVIDTIRDDVLAYGGLVVQEPSELGAILQAIVADDGTEALCDETRLRALLGEHGLNEREVAKIILFTKTDGFARLMSGEDLVKRTELNGFVHNAIVQTGLNRAEVSRIAAAFAMAAGIAYDYSDADVTAADISEEMAFVVPYELYDKSMNDFGMMLGRAIQTGAPLDELDYGAIEPLARMGLPKAKYYLGYCMIHGTDDVATCAAGYDLLREASEAGDIQASAELGDYYYNMGVDTWTAAYAYYTGIGSLALNAQRCEAMANIINRREFNRVTLSVATAMLAAMFVTTFLSLGDPAFAGHLVMGVVCEILAAGVLVFGFLHHRVNPYDETYVFPFAVFAFWALYMVVRFLF